MTTATQQSNVTSTTEVERRERESRSLALEKAYVHGMNFVFLVGRPALLLIISLGDDIVCDLN